MGNEPLNPAASLIKKSGGHDVVADWTGATVTSVYRWTYAKEKGGTGGRIPQDRINPWIEKANDNGVRLTLADFFHEHTSPGDQQ